MPDITQVLKQRAPPPLQFELSRPDDATEPVDMLGPGSDAGMRTGKAESFA